MNRREHATRLLILLGMIALIILIIERLWAFGGTLASVLSTLAGAWFLSFTVRPFIEALNRCVFPSFMLRTVEKRFGPDPVRRLAYVQACADHLRAGGLWLAALFHDVKGQSGPPHAIPMPEMRSLAQACFEVLHLGEAVNSHPRRAGREFLLVARKR